MRGATTSVVLLGTFTILLIAACNKDSEEPTPPTNNGPNTPTVCQYDTTVTDIDGNVYPVVIIGSQHWMTQNLRTTRYRDGSIIPKVMDGTTWSTLTTGAWSNYENNSGYDSTYGKLYNWYAASNPDLCPIGWHLPTDDEWTQLADQLSGWNVAGGKLKATTLWNSPNAGATNETCFSGFPGGIRVHNGEFSGIGDWGEWWSNSVSGTETAYFRMLVYGNAGIHSGTTFWRSGFCIRCLKD